eukprot:m.239908 g.239908  ORF g.239908 m.239908 type:complete len:346 (+) comp15298_c0_seq2:320-1357(+)
MASPQMAYPEGMYCSRPQDIVDVDYSEPRREKNHVEVSKLPPVPVRNFVEFHDNVSDTVVDGPQQQTILTGRNVTPHVIVKQRTTCHCRLFAGLTLVFLAAAITLGVRLVQTNSKYSNARMELEQLTAESALQTDEAQMMNVTTTNITVTSGGLCAEPWFGSFSVYLGEQEIVSMHRYDFHSMIQLRGIHTVDLTLLLSSEAVVEHKIFDTYARLSESERLHSYLRQKPTGTVILFGILDEGTKSLSNATVLAIEEFGSTLIGSLANRQSWAMIGVKGARTAGTAVVEAVSNDVGDRDECKTESHDPSWVFENATVTQRILQVTPSLQANSILCLALSMHQTVCI